MDRRFFIKGNFVVFGCIRQLVSPSNSNKTIREFLKENNLLGYERYLLSPPLLISILYGTFVVCKEQIQENEEIIEAINEKMIQRFKVIRNDNNFTLHRAIRNALAHYRVDLIERDGEAIITFEDSHKGETHFIAEIEYLSLKSLIEEIAPIIDKI